jgi:hypothetical protein
MPFVRSQSPPDCTQVLVQLLWRFGTDHYTRYARVVQYPSKRNLRRGLAMSSRDSMQMFECHHASIQKTVLEVREAMPAVIQSKA